MSRAGVGRGWGKEGVCGRRKRESRCDSRGRMSGDGDTVVHMQREIIQVAD